MAETTQTQASEVRLFNSTVGSNSRFAGIGKASTYASYRDKLRSVAANGNLFGDFINTMFLKVSTTLVSTALFSTIFDRFRIAQGSDVGSVIEEVFVGAVTAQQYSQDVSAAEYIQTKYPKIYTTYHTITRKQVYKFTINTNQLRTQVQSGSTLTDISARIIEAAKVSNTRDEYKAIVNLITDSYHAGDIQLAEVGDTTTADGARDFSILARAVYELMDGENRYNTAGVINSTFGEKSLIVDPYAKATMDVKVLANAFNRNDASPYGSILTLNQTWSDPNIVGLMLKDEWLVIANNTFDIRSQENYMTMGVHYALHVWDVIAKSPFQPAVMFVHEVPKDQRVRLIPEDQLVGVGNLKGDTKSTGLILQEAIGLKDHPASGAWTYTVDTATSTNITKFVPTILDNVLTVTLSENIDPEDSAEIVITATPAEGVNAAVVQTVVLATGKDSYN